MNILYLCERDPRDTHFGGAQRTNFIWRALQQCGEVYSICFDQQYDTEEIAPRIWHGKKLLKVNAWHYFWYRLERKILEPFNVLPLWPMPTKLEKSIDEIFPDIHFDVVVCRYCFDLAEMHLWNFPKVYVDFDDHPLEMYDTLKGRNVQSWLRPIGRFILKCQMAFIEKKIRGGWVSNPDQKDRIHTIEPIVGLKNIANSPSNNYQLEAKRKNLLMFIGGLRYYPHYSGLEKFLFEVWPFVLNKYSDMRFVIVGKDTKEYFEERGYVKNVEGLGFVDNLEQLYQECLATVVPIYSGGGTCIKTRESLAFSRVCLSSPFGARGLEDCLSEGNKCLRVFNSVDEFMNILDKVIMDDEARLSSEREGREYIQRTHSFESFVNTIKHTIEK